MTNQLTRIYWEHDLSPFLIRFGEHSGIRYYGLAYLAGFVAAGWLFYRYHRAGRSPLDLNAAVDLVFALVVGVIVGGRLGSYFLYDGWRGFGQDPWGIFKLWHGGMASHGGMVGVVGALAWFARQRRVDFRRIADLVCTAAPVGLFFGRVANFINGELWGRHAEVPWAVIFAQTGGGDFPRHPSQLYEAGLEGLCLFVLMQWRFWRTDIAARTPGRIAGEFLLAYAAVRAVGELFREPDASLIFGLTRGTFYSLFLIAGGWLMVWWSRHGIAVVHRRPAGR